MIDVEMLAMSVPVCPGLRFCKHLSVSMARYATLLGCVFVDNRSSFSRCGSLRVDNTMPYVWGGQTGRIRT